MNFNNLKRNKSRQRVVGQNRQRWSICTGQGWSMIPVFLTLLLKQFELTDHELSEAMEKIGLQNQEQSEKSIKITQQNSSIELLLNKTREFENETERLKESIKQIESKLSDYQVHSNRLESNLKNTKSILLGKNKENQFFKTEIERLKNLKWYNKLIGMK